MELNIATIDPQAPELAEKWGLGLELDEFCVAENMDEPVFSERLPQITPLLARTRVLHAPFAELFPCAIDPKVRSVAFDRMRRAAELCAQWHIPRMVVHSGYVPSLFFEEWYISQSVPFFRRLLRETPQSVTVCVENVLDPTPEALYSVVSSVDDPRLRICLDIGHAHVQRYSTVEPEKWAERCAPFLGHVHLHSNDGSWDLHAPLGTGTLDYAAVLHTLLQKAPGATYTLEHAENSEQSLLRLKQDGFL